MSPNVMEEPIIKLHGKEFEGYCPLAALCIADMDAFTLRGMCNINKTDPWNGLVYEPCNANQAGWTFMVIDYAKEMAIAYYL